MHFPYLVYAFLKKINTPKLAHNGEVWITFETHVLIKVL